MQVEAILRAKGSLVHTVPHTARLADAVAVLNEHNIGAVVVTEPNGHVAGILSERDVVRALASGINRVLDEPVRTRMTAMVVTGTRETSLDELMTVMTNRRVRHVPILEGGDLIGIVSIGDVVKRKIEETQLEADALREYIAT
jgi:CBS domain-containing protein